MLNIEKYKDAILNANQSDITCCVIDLYHNGVCPDDCKDCKKAAMKWLLSECKEPILTDSEREYLSAVIKPFRKNADFVCKNSNILCEYISIGVNNNDYISLPAFKPGEMYKCMEKNKLYTPEELGL